MFNNQEFSNQELNNEKLNQLQEGLFEEISEEESENVNGGYWGFYPVYPMSTDYFIQERIWGDPTGSQSFIDNVIYGY